MQRCVVDSSRICTRCTRAVVLGMDNPLLDSCLLFWDILLSSWQSPDFLPLLLFCKAWGHSKGWFQNQRHPSNDLTLILILVEFSFPASWIWCWLREEWRHYPSQWEMVQFWFHSSLNVGMSAEQSQNLCYYNLLRKLTCVLCSSRVVENWSEYVLRSTKRESFSSHATLDCEAYILTIAITFICNMDCISFF